MKKQTQEEKLQNESKIQEIIERYKKQLPERIDQRFGRCFEFTAYFLVHNYCAMEELGGVIVHGYASGKDFYSGENITTNHAWIQFDNLIYDPVAGVLVYENDGGWSLVKRKPVKKYTPKKALNFIGRKKNAGPWEHLQIPEGSMLMAVGG